MLNYIHKFFKDKTYEFKINKIIPANFTNENRNEYFVYFDEYYRKTGVSASKSKYGFMFIFDEKDKLFEYNKNYENPCFAFVSTSYAQVGICVYYISDGKIMYDWYDSYYLGS